jgi:hypothetical protein
MRGHDGAIGRQGRWGGLVCTAGYYYSRQGTWFEDSPPGQAHLHRMCLQCLPDLPVYQLPGMQSGGELSKREKKASSQPFGGGVRSSVSIR